MFGDPNSMPEGPNPRPGDPWVPRLGDPKPGNSKPRLVGASSLGLSPLPQSQDRFLSVSRLFPDAFDLNNGYVEGFSILLLDR